MLSPVELAEVLGQPPPTTEQAGVIAAPLEPLVVIAGAGSGKSETMAARVVWLVACGFVRPEHVLGLTFTRKAASELAARVRKRLARLAEVGLIESTVLDGEPAVSTYHAYAARLVTDHALREALEPTMRLITPAVQWQLAARVVAGHDGPMDAVELGPPSVTAAVLELAGEMAEHLRTSDDVVEIGEWLTERLAEVPGKPAAAQRKPVTTQRAREQLLPLVEAYARVKAGREVLDYNDQMALSARIASRHREVGEIERSRYSVVLLDEYQDTSHAQLVLLRALFGGGHPVTAVGDPCQSIYGWRGASAGNLLRFPRHFPSPSGAPAQVRQLSTSFRNGERVLAGAAQVQASLRSAARGVPVLVPGPNRVSRGRIVCALHETAADEASWVAAEVARLLTTPAGTAPDGMPSAATRVEPADVAVLARKRAQFPLLRKALEECGIPVEVVGLGGLLTVPEVADIVATLRVLYDPTAGDALIRLMAGPRWRIGPADLVALSRRARELSPDALPRPDRQDEDPLVQAVAEMAEERGSLIDALDDLGDALDSFSSAARTRLPALAAELRVLRGHVSQPLPDLVTEVERVLGLDIEVGARGSDPVSVRADLDAFHDAASRFAGDAEDPTLGAFLAYLKAAESEEFGLEAGRVGETNNVKLLTIHAAKGLEWPVVIVPGLAELRGRGGQVIKGSVFPACPVTNTRWTENPRKLPYPLRGDRDDLPALPGLAKETVATFIAECQERDLLEERRLAYVAVTRAHLLLIASGYRWGSGTRPLSPSIFLRELREACDSIAVWADEPEDGAENPALTSPAEAPWPAPAPAAPSPVTEGARMVEEAIAGGAAARPAALRERDRRRVSAWARDTELLLAERDRDRTRRRTGSVVELPPHLSVSALVTLAGDPGLLARQIRRPLPRPPAPFARRGTAFHRWLETRWGQQRLIDEWDLPGAADESAAEDAALSSLQAAFEASSWASREPVEVEVPFETVIGDRQIRGRMDAVFAAPGGEFEVVDWKTGKPLRGKAARAAAVQLAAYRLAWADLAGVPLSQVKAAFHYVRSNETVRPVDLLDADGLLALIEAVPEART